MLLRATAKGGFQGELGESGHAAVRESDAVVSARLAAAGAGLAAPLTAAAAGAGVVADAAAGWTVASSPDGLVAAAYG